MASAAVASTSSSALGCYRALPDLISGYNSDSFSYRSLLPSNDNTRLELHTLYIPADLDQGNRLETEISKRHAIGGIGLQLAAALDACRRAAGRCCEFASRIMRSMKDGRPDNGLEVARTTNACHPLQIDLCGERLELNKFIGTLSIGDRVRLFCNDGVLVAEKISPTQFKVIHSQTLTEWIH